MVFAFTERACGLGAAPARTGAAHTDAAPAVSSKLIRAARSSRLYVVDE
jgi:hypothetical protein